MKLAVLDIVCCPRCRHGLVLAEPSELNADDEVETGTLQCLGCSALYPVVRGIPRFVDEGNYADSFGYQWTKFSRTQLDEHLGIPLSASRFTEETRWPPVLSGQRILEAGSGMGRFTCCAAATGAEVVSFDFSQAIEANYRNNRNLPNVHFLQADICNPPFPSASFDKVFCFGVLQHTPDPERSFRSLLELLKPAGELVADVYQRTWKTLFWGQYYLRVLTKRVPPARLFPLVQAYFDVVHRLTGFVLPINNHAAKVLSLVLGTADYRGLYPVRQEVMREWCLLDTFDKLSPAFDKPQTLQAVWKWREHVEAASFDVRRGYNGLEIHVRR